MDIGAFLQRIEHRVAELGTSVRAVSIEATGKPDTIRNWLRRHEKGETFSMRQASIDAVARALSVSPAWLITGSTGGTDILVKLPDEATTYDAKPSESAAVQALFSRTAQQADVLYRAEVALPSLGIAPGDLVVCDLGRDSRVGDTVAVTCSDAGGGIRTVIRRWFSPWLLSGEARIDAQPMRDDQSGVTVCHPVIGSIRGA